MLTSAPEDYGLSPEATLAHTVSSVRPAGFDAFWAGFRDEVGALSTAWVGTPEPGVSRLVVPSLRDVRVAVRSERPAGALRAVIVTSHGSGAEADFDDGPEPWAQDGIAVVRLRVRGYPPSTYDVGDLRGDWIEHGLHDPGAWIVRGAVADVMQAVRCARRAFGARVPIMLHGESLGGGLAVLAAAQLALLDAAPARIALALPTFGDWRWRADRYCAGTGALVSRAIVGLRDESSVLRAALLLYDAALHAPDITVPALCKLALRDDVVPAPSAAAICNALGSRVRRRFVSPFGHYDGGLANTRRHVEFDRLVPCFLDPDVDPATVPDEAIERKVRGSEKKEGPI